MKEEQGRNVNHFKSIHKLLDTYLTEKHQILHEKSPCRKNRPLPNY
jgi:hypothetical protein